MIVSRKDTTTSARSRGFILIATLALLALTVATLIAMIAFMRSQSDLVEIQRHQAAAKRHALIAIDMSLGNLQRYAGSDTVVTLPAATLLDNDPSTLEIDDVSHPHWTYVAGHSALTSRWLVSSLVTTPDPMAPIPSQHAVTVVGAGSVGTAPDAPTVQAARIPLRGPDRSNPASSRTVGHTAWWVGELNTQANLAVGDGLADAVLPPYERTVYNLSQPRRGALEALFPALDLNRLDYPNHANAVDQDALLADDQLYFVAQDYDAIQRGFHDFTTRSFGVLSRPGGGLKINLSDRNYRDSLITDEVVRHINPDYWLRQGRVNQPAANYIIEGNREGTSWGANQTPATGELIRSPTPMITEFRLSMGIFHTYHPNSGKNHRLRYHMYVEWLNPYAYNIGFRASKGYVILLDGLPTLQVTNLGSGDGFSFDMNAFDQAIQHQGELYRIMLHSWMEFAPLSNQAMGFLRGIDPGSVYTMTEPSLTTQEEGLSRVAAHDPHRWDYRSATAPTPPAARQSESIYGDDEIAIHSTNGDSVRLNLTVIPVKDSDDQGHPLAKNVNPMDYLASNGWVLKLINIPFDPIAFSLSGNQYSRELSTDFSPADYRIAFHFKLRDKPGDLNRLAALLPPNQPILDFADPEVASLFEISADVRAASVDASGQFSHFELFHDPVERRNQPPTADTTRLHAMDHAVVEPTSVGVFSQLTFVNRPHPWVGSRAAGAWNEVYDSYFFTGPVVGAAWKDDLTPWEPRGRQGGLLANHRLQVMPYSDGTIPAAAEVTEATAASNLLVKGAFNLHSASVEAWTAVLKNALAPNASFSIQSQHATASAPNVFARLPFGAPRLGTQQADSLLDRNARKALLKQGVRSLDGTASDPDATLRLLAGAIVSGIRHHTATTGTPIRSVAALANAGILEDAITASGVNAGIETIAPTYLRQSDLLAQLAPLLQVRSDTFRIRAYGDSVAPLNGEVKAQVVGEAIVQRVPDYFDPLENASMDEPSTLSTTNLAFGRRFRVLQFRWLQPHEI